MEIEIKLILINKNTELIELTCRKLRNQDTYEIVAKPKQKKL
jgi:hypothetical protein